MNVLHSTSRKQHLLHLLNKRHRLQASPSQGFTLIELLVVIVILGVLGAVGYQAYINQIARANEAVAQTAATAAAKACAANIVIPEPGFAIDDFVDGDRVVFSPAAPACAAGAVFSVLAGSGGANPATATAEVGSGGAVCPGGCN